MPFRRQTGYGRGSLIALLVAAHAGVIAIATLGSPTRAVARPSAITVSEVREVAPALPATEPKLVVFATDVTEPSIDIADEAPPVAPTIFAAAPSGGSCAISDQVQVRLRASPEVRAALDRMPRAARSVADAVLLWNGRWIDTDSVGGTAAIEPIRAVVDSVVHALPADCRTATVTGPRFVFVPSADGDRILTFGSGEWTWAEVLAG